MDLSSLKNYSLSLTNYLGGGKAGNSQDFGANLMNTIAASKAAVQTNDAAAGVKIELSAEAQKLMSEESANSDGSSTLSGVQKGAQNFVVAFFDQSGLDLDNLSEEALGIIQGLQDVIEGSAATGRDISTDTAEEKYAGGTRKVYTLSGNGTRLRLAVEYAEGKPQKLSVTDITGGQVETAEITLQNGNKDSGTMQINRTQREYVNGHMTALAQSDPLEVGLYTAS